ncbi:hypothetical protein Pmani_033304 [Petrolisthes manimaculis]|uniref:Uncharacterized protein n=1 Tax=Petrolisthes manimaculis TaxID=1843537 RepID=A0AAE1NQ06_9EUCA|nr:hypothetical protein Pmani_033304 [Petrolisthes manimaculis]
MYATYDIDISSLLSCPFHPSPLYITLITSLLSHLHPFLSLLLLSHFHPSLSLLLLSSAIHTYSSISPPSLTSLHVSVTCPHFIHLTEDCFLYSDALRPIAL